MRVPRWLSATLKGSAVGSKPDQHIARVISQLTRQILQLLVKKFGNVWLFFLDTLLYVGLGADAYWSVDVQFATLTDLIIILLITLHAYKLISRVSAGQYAAAAVTYVCLPRTTLTAGSGKTSWRF